MTEVLAALGLAGAAGLNAWIPLLLVGVGVRFFDLDPGAPYDLLAEWPVLGLVAVALVTDLVADKIATVDHVLHAIGTVVHPIAGALVAAGQSGADIPPVLLVVAGALTAETIHLGRAALRPLATGLTFGLGNPVLSALEDASSLMLALLALLLPVLALLALVGLLAVAVVLAARRRPAA